nr:MAG: major capsid protein [Microvirus sp.]
MTVKLQRRSALTDRAMRNPQHSFSIKASPYQIVPTMIAPVQPGDTLKNAMMQARVVTKPVASALTGWWAETFMFYVRLGDMEDAEDLKKMVVSPDDEIMANDSSAAHHYFAGRGINWVDRSLLPVIRHYFRDEGEEPGDFKIGNFYSAAAVGSSWWSSLVLEADFPTDDFVDGDGDPDPMASPNQWENQWAMYQNMRMMRLTTATFEEWLAQYGVQAPPNLHESDPERKIPELLRYAREWQYPSNTINPETGEPSSAVSWVLSERVDKSRFFGEPGFILGLMVVRPKIYFAKQLQFAASLLTSANAWLPAVFRNDPHASILAYQGGQGPLDAETTWAIDIKDLFLHGDQMLIGNAGYRLALPDLDSPSVNLKYPDETMVASLFAGTEPDASYESDGIYMLNIAGRLKDMTY